jgi:hypothetical protein
MEQFQIIEEPVANRCLEAIIAVCALSPSTEKNALIDCLVEVIDRVMNPPMFLGSNFGVGTNNEQTSTGEETTQG